MVQFFDASLNIVCVANFDIRRKGWIRQYIDISCGKDGFVSI